MHGTVYAWKGDIEKITTPGSDNYIPTHETVYTWEEDIV